MQLLHSLFAFLLLLPTLASAAVFPADSKVKMLDPKGFKRAMRANRTAVVAFVAPWCGHCQRMAPEYSKAADKLSPLIPLYAVDCDEQANKGLCAEQGIQGFPTVKAWPRGGQSPPETYNSGERTAGPITRWAGRAVPDKVKDIKKTDDVNKWAQDNIDLPRALLINKDQKPPLLWRVLGNNYRKRIAVAHHRDADDETAKALGLESDKATKVVIYQPGSTEPTLYDGATKYEALAKHFKAIVEKAKEEKAERAKDEL
ncbi:thioredoxin-like protein [Coniophora puteana RWD-64-598 SS2]|uniref:Thioredoxin-like protein n=1 Tax=Coniophora puteana (strain RWD-64-598) TaxID=741705 RepID=A0A5M3M7V2_CONPW|nr:thioredoxin-like protein [Coniophora puteana RWD-64-598 SS2]EIW75123.1 thioredoxin-like protein [Coniophora puteana RWD-64-598 SS2]